MRLICRLHWVTGWQVGATGPKAWLFRWRLRPDGTSESWRIFRAELQIIVKLESCWDDASVLPAVICSHSLSFHTQIGWIVAVPDGGLTVSTLSKRVARLSLHQFTDNES